MRYAHIAAGIGLVLGAVALQAPAAVAGDSDIDINPRNASPGSKVFVETTACGSETYGKGESKAGGSFHLFEGDREGVLAGEFQVPEGMDPSSDEVTVKCPPRTQVTGTYEVTMGGQPHGAVGAGFGDAGSGDTQPLVLGGVLLAGAAAGGLMRWRRYRSDSVGT
ncbi:MULTISPECIES: sortase [Streptomyces]|uniref:Sortase n=1 Tax=Streptomyces dengpaensis TaxID=2049881 RepID=A0ABN5I1Z7_9ACTN|nr:MULTISPECIES: sortase [Streptomyces]AVH57354.1 sortase [Streptomyces dengpaensis]PIB05367.1 sortase [Streptomyces sp. HG99]